MKPGRSFGDSVAQLVGDVRGDVARPSLGSVDDAHRMAILAFHNCGSACRGRRPLVGLAPGPAQPGAEILQHQIGVRGDGGRLIDFTHSQGFLELDESKLGAVLAAATWAVSSRPGQQKRDDKHTADGSNETESFRVCLPHGAVPALDAPGRRVCNAGAWQLGSKGTNAPHYQNPTPSGVVGS
jgi:hypothetical protein